MFLKMKLYYGQGKYSTEINLLALIDENFILKRKKETNKILNLTRRK